MRVNVESSVFTDVRFRLLAKKLKISPYDAIGRCVAIWMGCYDRRSKCLSRIEADASADLEGFADALLDVGLASVSRTKDADKIVIHGVELRIKFLQAQSDKGRKGGSSRKQESLKDQGIQQDSVEAKATAKATAKAQAEPEAKAQAYSLALTLAPDLALAPALKDLFTPPASGKAEPAEPKAKKATKHALPDDWAPNAKHAAKAKELGVLLGKATEEFRNYWGARGDTMKNWDLAFFTWLGNAVKFAARAGGGFQRPPEPKRHIPVFAFKTDPNAPDPIDEMIKSL